VEPDVAPGDGEDERGKREARIAQKAVLGGGESERADDAVRRARTRFDRSLAVGLSGAVVARAISCAFGDRFWSPVVASSFWVLCALVEDALIEPRPEVAA
jgi:hypothetical protein